MSEKKGNTVKLKFPFPEQLCCEVFSPGLDRWHRVTPNEFRSFVGKRRILHLEGDIKDNENVTSTYKDYDGPVYMYGTNKVINSSNVEVGKLAFVDDIDPREFKKEKEMHFDPKEDALREQLRKEGINPDMIDDSYGDEFEDFVDIVSEHQLNDNWDEYGDDSYEY